MSQDALLLLLRVVFALVAVVVVVAYVVRPLLRMVRQQPDYDLVTPNFAEMVDGEELEIPTEQEGEFNRNDAINQARSDPLATANLVQRWLKERR